MSGGGGFGDPLERDPDSVLSDVIQEKVTPEHAEREYGVVLVESEDPGEWSLDLTATENLREQLRTAAADWNRPNVNGLNSTFLERYETLDSR